VARIKLTDDEVGMLYWLIEFPGRANIDDATVTSLFDRGLLMIEGGVVVLSQTGLESIHLA